MSYELAGFGSLSVPDCKHRILEQKPQYLPVVCPPGTTKTRHPINVVMGPDGICRGEEVYRCYHTDGTPGEPCKLVLDGRPECGMITTEGSYILGGLAAVLVLYGGYKWYQHRQEQDEEVDSESAPEPRRNGFLPNGKHRRRWKKWRRKQGRRGRGRRRWKRRGGGLGLTGVVELMLMNRGRRRKRRRSRRGRRWGRR